MRSRQFIMKDLYTFDADFETARDTYEIVCQAYNKIFSRIGIDFVKGGIFANRARQFFNPYFQSKQQQETWAVRYRTNTII